MLRFRAWLTATLFIAPLLFSPMARAATTVLFDPATPATGPFPTDYLTVPDYLQKTKLRLNLPLPPCATQYTSCQETGLLEQADGFSIRARGQAKFSGPINASTLSGGLFYIALNELTNEETGINKIGDVIGVDQVIYDPSTNTVYAKPLSALDQHRRYAFVVTDAVLDSSGAAVASSSAYSACLAASDAYCSALAQAVNSANPGSHKIVAASVFTTMSATAWLEHARDALPFYTPYVQLLTPQIPISTLATFTLHEQTGTSPVKFTDLSLPVSSGLLTGIDRLVMGLYQSPVFLGGDNTIPPAPTGTVLALPSATQSVYFNALLPSSTKPAAGYPVVIFGHGFGDSRFGGPTAVAPTLAKAGFAVIAINAVGHGFGPYSTVSFTDTAGNSKTFTSGGRGIDLNGDGVIDSEEGCPIVTPVATGLRDCFRQTVVDLLQLARAIRQGIDLDGDGTPDLDGTRIYYGGQSLGAMYGTIFMALDGGVRAAALNVGGATTVDIARVSPAYVGFSQQAMGLRSPSLLNQGSGYNEDYVLPGLPPHTTTVAGAIPIQQEFETLEWLAMPGDPMAFAPHLQVSPLAGNASRPILVQFARADMTMPNPANSGLIRAGNLLASTWEYRHDLARAVTPDLPLDPHPFLVLFVSLGSSGITLPGLDGLAISLDAQGQLAGFYAADGKSIPNPNGISAALYGFNVFQQPTVLPEDLGY